MMNDNAQGMLIHRIFFPVTVLGPGKERLGIWTQGCSIHCSECMTPESWSFDHKYFLDFNTIEELICKSILEGYSSAVISGGEPFDQPDGLYILLSLLRKHTFTDILVYSGYEYIYVLEKFPNCLHFIDLLITGPFIVECTNNNKWRGSDNQEIHVVNKKCKYLESDLEKIKYSTNREIQLIQEDNKIFLIGIPNRGDLKQIKNQNLFDL